MEKEIFEKVITRMIASGYAVYDGFVSEQLLLSLRQNLKALYSKDSLKEAGIGKWNHFQKDKSIRNDKIRWISEHSENEGEQHFLSLIGNFVEYLNATCFAGIKSYEFHYALYQKGAFYKRHIDQFMNDLGRKFTVILYLNDDWKDEDGGELVLYLDDETIKIAPVGGRVVFFESHKIEHEVKPASRDRMSVTGWLKNTEAKVII